MLLLTDIMRSDYVEKLQKLDYKKAWPRSQIYIKILGLSSLSLKTGVHNFTYNPIIMVQFFFPTLVYIGLIRISSTSYT